MLTVAKYAFSSAVDRFAKLSCTREVTTKSVSSMQGGIPKVAHLEHAREQTDNLASLDHERAQI